MGAFQGLDAFGKVRFLVIRAVVDLHSRRRWKMSRSGRRLAPYVGQGCFKESCYSSFPLVTFISLAIIAVSTILEFIDYRRVHLEPSIIVDRSRGEKLVVDMDIFFPRVPCYCESVFLEYGASADRHAVLSLDIMDISGERQMDLQHDITKTRINKDGQVVAVIKNGRESSLPCVASTIADTSQSSKVKPNALWPRRTHLNAEAATAVYPQLRGAVTRVRMSGRPISERGGASATRTELRRYVPGLGVGRRADGRRSVLMKDGQPRSRNRTQRDVKSLDISRSTRRVSPVLPPKNPRQRFAGHRKLPLFPRTGLPIQPSIVPEPCALLEG